MNSVQNLTSKYFFLFFLECVFTLSFYMQCNFTVYVAVKQLILIFIAQILGFSVSLSSVQCPNSLNE